MQVAMDYTKWPVEDNSVSLSSCHWELTQRSVRDSNCYTVLEATYHAWVHINWITLIEQSQRYCACTATYTGIHNLYGPANLFVWSWYTPMQNSLSLVTSIRASITGHNMNPNFSGYYTGIVWITCTQLGKITVKWLNVTVLVWLLSGNALRMIDYNYSLYGLFVLYL